MIDKIYSYVHLLIIIYTISLIIPVIVAELRAKYILKSINDIDNLKIYYKKITKKLLIAKICFGVFVFGGLLLTFLSTYNIVSVDILRLLPIISPVPVAPFLYYSSIERKLVKKQ